MWVILVNGKNKDSMENDLDKLLKAYEIPNPKRTAMKTDILALLDVVGQSEQLSLSAGGCYNCPKCGKGLHVSDYEHKC